MSLLTLLISLVYESKTRNDSCHESADPPPPPCLASLDDYIVKLRDNCIAVTTATAAPPPLLIPMSSNCFFPRHRSREVLK